MADAGITCVVTIHGVGFQQPPSHGEAGYADNLHRYLCDALNQHGAKMVSDDPGPHKRQNIGSLPVYVQSVWPVPAGKEGDGRSSWEAGLQRLGSWREGCWTDWTAYRTVEVSEEARLVEDGFRIAHVALVYSGLEGTGPEVASSLEALAMMATNGQRYGHIGRQLALLFQEVIKPRLALRWTNLLAARPSTVPTESPSLRIRQDAGSPYLKSDQDLHDTTGPLALLRQLENDVAVYVCQNIHRQRVRDFVREALLRLALRDDVASIVLNTHSNGTIIGLDVVQELPPLAAKKIRAIVTAGSPLRKYVDLFAWGEYMTVVPPIVCWKNFWDQEDIVADPLRPPASWRRPLHQPLTDDDLKGDGIYQILKPDGSLEPMPLEDIRVDNAASGSPGDLPAHNYWENRSEFIPRLAALLADVVENKPCRQLRDVVQHP